MLKRISVAIRHNGGEEGKRWPRAARLSLGLAAIALCPFWVSAQEARIDLVRSIDWTKQKLEATAVFDIASAGLKMPAGRTEAEIETDLAFPALVRPTVYGIGTDSSATLEQQLTQGAIGLADIEGAIAGAEQSPAVLSADLLTLTKTYVVDLAKLSSAMIRHRKPTEPPRVIQPRATKTYTGIVIYADEKLAVHGTHSEAFAAPCLFPKIWDSEMNLIFERNMVDPAVAKERAIVRYARKADAEKQADLAGDDPLRILATGLFGMNPTDPIVDRDDALKILSSDENRKLIRDGKIVIILGDAALGKLP